jgi:signal transduction histidine kinase
VVAPPVDAFDDQLRYVDPAPSLESAEWSCLKLVPKLALALFVGVFAVVAGLTAWQVRREIELFDQDVRRDQRIVGITAGAALSSRRTREDAVKLASRVDQSREAIRVRYVSLSPDAPKEWRPLVPIAREPLAKRGGWYQLVKPRTAGEKADTLVTYVAAAVVDEPHGAIELVEPLASRTDYAWRGVWSALASSLAMLAVGGVTMTLIGARLVGRPVAELMSAARRIGEGNFDVLATVKRQDEFGELGRALHAMGSDLSHERLRRQAEVDARIAALEQLRHAERLSTLGKLASVLAHEIGTPLNVIAGHAKLIESGKVADSEARESATAIGEQCGRITGIVRRVLDYARRRPPKRASVNAGDLLGQIAALLTSFADRHGVSLTCEARADDIELMADSDQLQQTLINVVINAIQAASPGGHVKLSLRAATEAPQEQVVFTVSDDGAGMDAATKARIFEPFFTTKPAGEGTGLGLSVAREIVAEHGGTVEVSSVQGQGTTFTIGLPRSVEDVRSHSSS